MIESKELVQFEDRRRVFMSQLVDKIVSTPEFRDKLVDNTRDALNQEGLLETFDWLNESSTNIVKSSEVAGYAMEESKCCTVSAISGCY